MLLQHRRTIRVNLDLARNRQPRHLQPEVVRANAGKQGQETH